MGKESCLLLPLLLFLLFSKTAQQDNVKQSTQIIVLLQNILEGEQSNGECFSYSNSFYLCTGSDDWEKGLAYFDDFVPSQGLIFHCLNIFFFFHFKIKIKDQEHKKKNRIDHGYHHYSKRRHILFCSHYLSKIYILSQ